MFLLKWFLSCYFDLFFQHVTEFSLLTRSWKVCHIVGCAQTLYCRIGSMCCVLDLQPHLTLHLTFHLHITFLLMQVCNTKKGQLGTKNSQLMALSNQLEHCMKFTQHALNSGSDTALLYSKHIISNQLRNTLRMRCEVPNPQHKVGIQAAMFTDTYRNNKLRKLLL